MRYIWLYEKNDCLRHISRLRTEQSASLVDTPIDLSLDLRSDIHHRLPKMRNQHKNGQKRNSPRNNECYTINLIERCGDIPKIHCKAMTLIANCSTARESVRYAIPNPNTQSLKKTTKPPPTIKIIQIKMLARILPKFPSTWHATAPLCKTSMKRAARGSRAVGASMNTRRARFDRFTGAILCPKRMYNRKIRRRLAIKKSSERIKYLWTSNVRPPRERGGSTQSNTQPNWMRLNAAKVRWTFLTFVSYWSKSGRG